MNKSATFLGLTALFGFLNACGAGRDVAVTGSVQASSGVTLSGPVRVEIIDRLVDGENIELVPVDSVVLAEPGVFDTTVALEGTDVLVRALNDTNDDAACSSGEAWAEAQVQIAEDDTAKVPTLSLALTACPPPAAEE